MWQSAVHDTTKTSRIPYLVSAQRRSCCTLLGAISESLGTPSLHAAPTIAQELRLTPFLPFSMPEHHDTSAAMLLCDL
jgi:hypothetical protein